MSRVVRVSGGSTGFHKRQQQKSDRQAKAARVQKDQVLGQTLGQVLAGDSHHRPLAHPGATETLPPPRELLLLASSTE